VQQLLAWIDSRERVPAIVCGDFNAIVCLDKPSPDDASLWPSDHAGVWADLELGQAGP
jgi:endonuclease/exonuclease/phosphatase family metal-dependent hydrolase